MMTPRSRTHGHLGRGGRCLRLAALKRGVPSSARWLLRTGATVGRGKDPLACVRYRTDAAHSRRAGPLHTAQIDAHSFGHHELPVG